MMIKYSCCFARYINIVVYAHFFYQQKRIICLTLIKSYSGFIIPKSYYKVVIYIVSEILCLIVYACVKKKLL